MTDLVFGGTWTEVKLDCLKKYLAAYRQIFTSNRKAHYFKTWYVDAFAGTGSRAEAGAAPETQLFLDVYADSEPAAFRDGSTKIALGLPAPFDNYLFIEKRKKRVQQLQATVAQDFPILLSRCTFKQGDANAVLRSFPKKILPARQAESECPIWVEVGCAPIWPQPPASPFWRAKLLFDRPSGSV